MHDQWPELLYADFFTLQVITWLYTSNLDKAERFLREAVSLTKVFSGGRTEWTDCGVWGAPGSGHGFFLGLCNNGRAPPTDLNEAAVTVTLVMTSSDGVDAWHSLLSAAPTGSVNLTKPEYSKEFDVYAFNFYDTDPQGLGNYRFEVQVFDDPDWPSPHGAASAALTRTTPDTPQQVTWMYTENLAAADTWLQGSLGFTKVLTQTTCNIYLPSSEPRAVWFLGVCNSRPAPSTAFAPVTYTLVVQNKSVVESWHSFLTKTSTVKAMTPAEVTKYNVFGFDFNDADPTRLGKYRFSVQSFNDPSWPGFKPPLSTCGQYCASDADCDPSQPCKRCEIFILKQCVT